VAEHDAGARPGEVDLEDDAEPPPTTSRSPSTTMPTGDTGKCASVDRLPSWPTRASSRLLCRETTKPPPGSGARFSTKVPGGQVVTIRCGTGSSGSSWWGAGCPDTLAVS
jgi:hypothetical protein